MKCQIPQISWHSRDPVLSIDFQHCLDKKLRLASGGTDSHVLIWYVTCEEGSKSINIECASDLYRHNKSVNVVRFSPLGDILASGDDEGALFLWQLKERDSTDVAKDDDNINLEDWYPLKLLRGHLEDIYDISWSADGNYLVSGSMDNTAIMWDVQKFQKLHIFSDSKGYVQGVAWDPLNIYLATIGTDRALRFLNINTKKTAFRVQRAPWSVSNEKGSFRARLFHDDTFKSYFRRLCFTPDGGLLIVPSGILEKDDKSVNTTYIFSRHAPNKVVAYLPTGDKYTVAVRCSPLLYKLRCPQEIRESDKYKPILNLPYRMVFAVAACDSILIYDTEQLVPIAYISNIHYTCLTDLTWSADGRILVASSTDGYCSFIIFNDEELGEVYEPPTPIDSPTKEEVEKEPLMPQVNAQDNTVNEPLPQQTSHEKSVEIELAASNAKVSETPETNSVLTSPSANNLKPKKPKLTIKNFFASPKPNTSTTANKMETDVQKDKESATTNTAVAEQIKSDNSADKLNSACCDESCSVEIICENFKSNTKIDSKEKADISFSDKIKSIKTESVTGELDLKAAKADPLDESAQSNINENDWRLELSQDEDIGPTSTQESDSSKKVEPMIVTESNSSEITKTPTKPKRRINFITLSTKINKSPQKE